MVNYFEEWNNSFILTHLGGYNAVFYSEKEDILYYSEKSSIRADTIIGVVFFPMFIIGVFLHFTLLIAISRKQINNFVVSAVMVFYCIVLCVVDMMVRNAVFSKVKRIYKKKGLNQVDKKMLKRIELSIGNELYGASVFIRGLCLSLFFLALTELCLFPFYPGKRTGMIIFAVFFLECSAYLSIAMKKGKRKRALAKIRQILGTGDSPPSHDENDN